MLERRGQGAWESQSRRELSTSVQVPIWPMEAASLWTRPWRPPRGRHGGQLELYHPAPISAFLVGVLQISWGNHLSRILSPCALLGS